IWRLRERKPAPGDCCNSGKARRPGGTLVPEAHDCCCQRHRTAGRFTKPSTVLIIKPDKLMSAALPIPPGIFRLSLPDICRSERYARGKSQKGRKAQLMRKFTQAAGSERGIALVAALLALLVLSTLTTAFIFVANTETST